MLKTKDNTIKKKKLNSTHVLDVFYVIFFMIIIGLPSLINLIGLNEKTTNVKRPILSGQTITSFVKDYEKYFNLKFSFKDTLIKYNSLFKYSILDSSMNSKVLVGKDGWMFPGSSENGDPISDYRGINLFTDKELIQIKNNLEERKSWLKSKDTDFVLVLFPNSNTVNYNFMPTSVKKYSEITRLDQLNNYLVKNSDIKVINTTTTLKNNKDKYLYNKTDSRLNQLGSYFAYSEIINSLKYENMKPYELKNYKVNYEKKSGGDLAKYLGIGELIKDTVPLLTPNFKSNFHEINSSDLKVSITENNIKSLPKVAFFLDNNCDGIKKYLSENFSRIVYKYDYELDTDLIVSEKPDIVACGILETSLNVLLSPNNSEIKVAKNKVSSSQEQSNDDKIVTKPIISSKTLLNPTTATIIGRSDNDVEIIASNNNFKSTTNASKGDFILQIKLTPGATNTITVKAKSKSGKLSDEAIITIAPDTSAPTKPVFVGKDGWLFSSDNIADYSGNNLFTNNQLLQIKSNLEKRRDFVKLSSSKSKFMLVLAPNKLSLYSEYAPVNLLKGDNSRYDQLVSFLKQNSDIEVLDLKNALLENKGDNNLYYKTDSHWNELGAYYGYKSIITEIEKDYPLVNPLDLNNFTINKIKEKGGDLAYYLGATNNVLKEEEVRLSTKTNLRSSYKKDASMTWVGKENNTFSTTLNNTNLPKAVVFRDSYTTNMMPYLSENFSKIVYNQEWNFKFNKTLVSVEKPDVVLYIVVERNLDKLLEKQ